MIDETLLSILACPETKKGLVPAEDADIASVNQAITEGKILNRNKDKVTEAVDGGLFREGDRTQMYPVRKGIPVLLVEELMDVQPALSS